MNQNKATRRVSFQTVGCRLNQYETERMAADLHRYGFRRVGRGEAADLYIINTCTVTHRADSDCRYLIRKAARQNPEARIVVAGCFVDKDAAAVEQMEQVHVVIRNREKDSMTKLLAERLPEMFSRQPIQSDADHIAEFYDHAEQRVHQFVDADLPRQLGCTARLRRTSYPRSVWRGSHYCT